MSQKLGVRLYVYLTFLKNCWCLILHFVKRVDLAIAVDPGANFGHYDFLILQYICPLRSVALSCNIKITMYVTIKYFGVNA